MTTASSKSRYGRFIPSEEIGEIDIAQWQFMEVDENRRRAAERALEQAQAPVIDEATVQRAWDEAFAQGREAGLVEARLEGQQRLDEHIAGEGLQAAARLEAVLAALGDRLAGAEQAMAQGVLEVACEIARQVIRRELRMEPDSLATVVRESLSMLVADGKPAVVRLHPEDQARWADELATQAGGANVRWVADPGVAPGGCLVEAAGAVVDGQVAKRWARAVAKLGVESEWSGDSNAPSGHD